MTDRLACGPGLGAGRLGPLARHRLIFALGLLGVACSNEDALFLRPPPTPAGARSVAIVAPPPADAVEQPKRVMFSSLGISPVRVAFDVAEPEPALHMAFYGCSLEELGIRGASDPELMPHTLPETHSLYERSGSDWTLRPDRPEDALPDVSTPLAPRACAGLKRDGNSSAGLTPTGRVQTVWADRAAKLLLMVHPERDADLIDLAAGPRPFAPEGQHIRAASDPDPEGRVWLLVESSTGAERHLVRFSPSSLAPGPGGVYSAALEDLATVPAELAFDAASGGMVMMAATGAGNACLVTNAGALWHWRGGSWSLLIAGPPPPIQVNGQVLAHYWVDVAPLGPDGCVVIGVCQQPSGTRFAACVSEVLVVDERGEVAHESIPSSGLLYGVVSGTVNGDEVSYAVTASGETYARDMNVGRWARRAEGSETNAFAGIALGSSAFYVSAANLKTYPYAGGSRCEGQVSVGDENGVLASGDTIVTIGARTASPTTHEFAISLEWWTQLPAVQCDLRP